MIPPEDRPIGLILDASAVVVFASGTPRAIHVGEPLTEVEDNGEVLGIPLLCLAEASQQTSSERLDILVASESVRVLGGEPDSFRALGAMREVVGDYPTALAALYAVDLDVLVLTADPDRYRLVKEGGIVNPIPEG